MGKSMSGKIDPTNIPYFIFLFLKNKLKKKPMNK